MSFILYQFVAWYFAIYHFEMWWLGLVAQPVLAFNLFSETWCEYAGVMRFKMILPQLGPKARALAWYNAYRFLIKDVVFRFVFAPFMFHELPIPKNRHDWLMTGVLHRIKSTYPVDSWQYKRADYMCSTMLDNPDPDGDHC